MRNVKRCHLRRHTKGQRKKKRSRSMRRLKNTRDLLRISNLGCSNIERSKNGEVSAVTTLPAQVSHIVGYMGLQLNRAESDFQILSQAPRCSVSPVKRSILGDSDPSKKSRHDGLQSRTLFAPQSQQIQGTVSPKKQDRTKPPSPLKPQTTRFAFSRSSSSSSSPRKGGSTDTLDTTITYPSTQENVIKTTKPISTWRPRPLLPPAERTVYILPRNPYQSALDGQDTPFAVQWELERQIARSDTVSWGDVEMDDISTLKGNAQEAIPKVERLKRRIEGCKAGHSTAHDIPVTSRRAQMHVEMDKEEISIRANDLRGVGSKSVDWPYGGKITYSILVEPSTVYDDSSIQTDNIPVNIPWTPSQARGPTDTPDNPFSPHPTQQSSPNRLPFTMTLLPPGMPGKSFRLARRFGSRRVLSVKWKSSKDNRNALNSEQLLTLFSGREFVLFGRRYAPIWAPADRNMVFMVEVAGPKAFRRGYEAEMLPLGRMLSSELLGKRLKAKTDRRSIQRSE
jgi:hypothetical protein